MKKLTAAVASALVLASAAHAAGLGKLTVLSALGQPLRAEIELTSVSPEEASGLAAKLASPEAFRNANIEFNPALLSLRFAVEQRGGRQFIRVSSTQPLNEPFVDLLLELTWNNGRLVREYTFLLDPAELRSTQAAQVAANDAPARPRAEQPAAAPAQSAPAPAPRRSEVRPPAEPAGQEAQETRAAASEYRVQRGDTLGEIAARVKPANVSLDMMLVALYRANPEAFIGNNMNRLKSGRILSVPDADSVRATSPGEARGVVVAQAADFNAYRNKLAGQVGAAEPVKAPPAGQSAGGRITARVEERPTAANEAQDQLRLSKAQPQAPAPTPGKGATMSAEDGIAKEKELADAQSRVKELERNVGDLEKLATVQNRAGAEAEKNAAAPKADAVLAEDKPVPKKLPPIKPAKPAPAAPEPGIFDFLMENLPLVGGGAAALLLAGLLVAQRRKKKEPKAVAEPSILGVPSEPAHSLFAETGGQSVDTNNSVFNSSFAPSASQLDTNEVDPVAEADVYIAYGRDAQAEEILKEALRTHPERLPVRLKLLEIYAARKDARAFEAQAGELHGLTRGHGDEWAQAAAMGLALDPFNPLYAGGAAAAAAPLGAEPGQPVPLAKEFDDAFHAPAQEDARAPMSFDQHFADAMGTAQPAPEPVTNAPARVDDDHVLDFDLGGLSFEPVTAETATPAAPSLDKKDANDLDFDMDAFTPAAPAPQVVEPAPRSPAEDPLDFTFDMDFDAPAKPANPAQAAADQPPAAPATVADIEEDPLFDLAFDQAPTPAPTPAPLLSPAQAAASDIDMADLAKEFDLPELPELPAERAAAPEQARAANELDDPLFDLDTMDFGLADKQPAPAPAEAPAVPRLDEPLDFAFEPAPALASNPSPAADDPLFDLSHLPTRPLEALPDELQTATPAASGAQFAESDRVEPQFDLAAMDLDLPGDGTLPLPEVHSLSGGDDGNGGGALSAAHMEMETKLDLAIAYQEIGDKEGARELLEEVIRGGSDEQVSRANALRAALA
ncbi:FimV/HubP family polar landmark protein [uncultured Massilia sp.]|uniref:FimV/HubP family polar landmark protein n=1 Tax=uncultured Massilia sp. TaxID=169973 RepID=UPI0025D6E6FF|nr:FimV/HubP family polar landmark protein [uncultured Massilia sp.]